MFDFLINVSYIIIHLLPIYLFTAYDHACLNISSMKQF